MNRLSNEENLQLANLLAKKVALDLDNSDESSLDLIGNLLLTIPVEASLTAVRTQIQIERCVKHSLDEHKVWGPLLESFNEG